MRLVIGYERWKVNCESHGAGCFGLLRSDETIFGRETVNAIEGGRGRDEDKS